MTGLKTFYISHSIRKVEDTFLKLKVIPACELVQQVKLFSFNIFFHSFILNIFQKISKYLIRLVMDAISIQLKNLVIVG